ncbi:hypothetical protein F443_08129 [Phytophthora nicotianae P1569]|uniref:Uncharacterized protein n=1 Tax=Phytophthora nicotianae P1569 TaxID=1317065 RepID=V9F9B6_PHYNI|nr:hypothetical protein F443_08129 [Phytophthora nicotianae P1569]
MEPTPASEERLPQQEVKRLVQEAMATKGFPPVMRYPETEVMELVQEGMLSPHGLTSTVDNMKRRREKRYYKLLSLFADRVRQNQLGNPTYMAPNPPIIAQYCSKQNPIGPDTLSAAWL